MSDTENTEPTATDDDVVAAEEPLGEPFVAAPAGTPDAEETREELPTAPLENLRPNAVSTSPEIPSIDVTNGAPVSPEGHVGEPDTTPVNGEETQTN